MVFGSVIRSRPIGILNMSDEAGQDAKLVAVPHDKLTTIYKNVKEVSDLNGTAELSFENLRIVKPEQLLRGERK